MNLQYLESCTGRGVVDKQNLQRFLQCYVGITLTSPMSPVPCWVVAAGWVVLLDCCCATLWSPDLTRHRCCDVTNHLPTHTTRTRSREDERSRNHTDIQKQFSSYPNSFIISFV